jgi:hypothetical protein
MAVLTDYATWASWLDRFARGDDADADGLPGMRGEELGGDAAQRFAVRCAEALDARLRLWLDALNRDVARASDPAQLRLALVHARARLVPIRRFAESPLLFPELRLTLIDSVASAVRQLQADLEQQVAGPGCDEAMIRVIRDVRMTAALDLALTQQAPDPLGTAQRSRTILFGGEADRG